MSDLKAEVKVYDPAWPFKTFKANNAALDTWHNHVLITAALRNKLPQIPTVGRETLNLSSGMSMKVPQIEIGVQIGSIRLDSVRALVVDEGVYDVLIGSDVLTQIFNFGRDSDEREAGGSEARITSGRKDDPRALGLEIFPIQPQVDVKQFESLLRYVRQLYNILLIASDTPYVHSSAFERVVMDDDLIPSDVRLQLAWVDSGSIWLTLKGSFNVLRSLASVFQLGASAKLEQQLSEAHRSQETLTIDQALRDDIIRTKKAEERKLRAGHLEEMQEHWRQGIRKNMQLFDDVIAQVDDPRKAERLKVLKDDALVQIVEQELFPVVRNYPLPFDPDEAHLLPSSSDPDSQEHLTSGLGHEESSD